ncbi:MAG: 50S ribosomal protein L4 [Prosthecobacter sp.]|jgi:large subunit ribosomal protein L4|nr:50S ribosomal protein L4 [Prosthecobacter sp.]HBJ87088.1 50S ribosomal protein L4 [Verrucomicrobiales bacterium]
MSATILSADAAKAANIQLTEGYKGSQALNDAVVAYRANRRQSNAHTKNRSEVAGSGKKLWNQKGTGNARMGSKRSPIWSGGGVVFGPRNTTVYAKKLPKSTKKLALRAALTARILDGEVLTTASFAIADGKTKSFIAAINGLTTAKKVLLIGKGFDEVTFRAARNVQNVQLISADDVNAEHLLLYPSVVVTGDALETLAKRTA